MKTLEELMAIKARAEKQMNVREEEGAGIRIVVGMATCGIAAGARPVLGGFVEEVAKRGLKNVSVNQTGCIGMCEKEVLVDVVRPGEARITYGKVTPEDVPKIIAEHVVNGHIVEELVVGRLDQE